jgi:hypothetical protein
MSVIYQSLNGPMIDGRQLEVGVIAARLSYMVGLWDIKRVRVVVADPLQAKMHQNHYIPSIFYYIKTPMNIFLSLVQLNIVHSYKY